MSSDCDDLRICSSMRATFREWGSEPETEPETKDGDQERTDENYTQTKKPRGIYHQTLVLAPIGRMRFMVRDFIRLGVPGGSGTGH